jgi:hypothetical protein
MPADDVKDGAAGADAMGTEATGADVRGDAPASGRGCGRASSASARRARADPNFKTSACATAAPPVTGMPVAADTGAGRVAA